MSTRISTSQTQLHAEMTVVWYYLYVEKESMMTSSVGPEHFVASPLLGEFWRKAHKLTLENQIVSLLEISEPHHELYEAISNHMVIATPRSMERLEKMMKESAQLHHAMVGTQAWLQYANDPEATVEELHAAFGEVASRFQMGDELEPETAGALARRIKLDFNDREIERGIPVPIIGSRVRHYKFKERYLVGGLTSNHKTTFALQSVRKAAEKGFSSVMWTLEDDNKEIGERTMAADGEHLTLDHFEAGVRGLNENTIEYDLVQAELSKLVEEYAKLKLFFLDKSLNLTKTIAQISRLVYKYGVRMVVIDFMQLIIQDNPRMSVTEHLTNCAQALADLAKRLNIVVIAVVQLTADATRRASEGSEPKIGDIRGGSAIAQASYGTIMVHKPNHDPDKPVPPKGMDRVQVWIKKWKRAKLGGIECFVDAPHDRINLAEDAPRKKFYSLDDD
jgi:replicative DNA helicase